MAYENSKYFRINTYKKHRGKGVLLLTGNLKKDFYPEGASRPGDPPSIIVHHSNLQTFQPAIVLLLAEWTSSPLQAIISLRPHRRGSHPSLRRGNEHFSKHTESAGVLSIRICGHATVDRRVVRRRDCLAGRSWFRWLYHAIPDEPGSRQAAGAK